MNLTRTCCRTMVNSCDAETTFVLGTISQKIFDNHLNPVMSVFIEKFLPSTLSNEYHVPGFQSFFSFVLYHFVTAKLATGSIRAILKYLVSSTTCRI